MSAMMLFPQSASSQIVKDEVLTKEDSVMLDSYEFSLLTCQPHDQVYSLYGHTAIRISDSRNQSDVVANWGVFDPNKPFFILRFVFGLTDYMMGVLPTDMFLEEYAYRGSGVYEQHLNLTLKEKKRILAVLQDNYMPENREYRYNFYYDNCTSRARDVIVSAIDGDVEYRMTEMQKGDRSFRDLIHWKNEGCHWAAFGNDVLLGVGSDRNTATKERQFLPEVLMADFDSAVIVVQGKQRPLVDDASWIVPPSDNGGKIKSDNPVTPFVCSLLLLVVVIVLTMMEILVLHRHLYVVDKVMFLLYGIVGVLLTVMIFSQHPTVRLNLQILLFCPALMFFAFARWKYTYDVVIACILLFFVGNLLQSYAEGCNILASCLLVRVVACKMMCQPRRFDSVKLRAK